MNHGPKPPSRQLIEHELEYGEAEEQDYDQSYEESVHMLVIWFSLFFQFLFKIQIILIESKL